MGNVRVTTDEQTALHNSLCFTPHPHDQDQDGNGPCRRCAHMVKHHPILHKKPPVYVRVTVINLEPPEEEERPFCHQNWQNQNSWQPEYDDGDWEEEEEEEEETSPPLDDDWYENGGVHLHVDSPPHVSSDDDMDDPYSSSSVKALFKSLYFKPQAHRHRRAYCRRCERRAMHELGAHLSCTRKLNFTISSPFNTLISSETEEATPAPPLDLTQSGNTVQW
ncbi:hypothetical protein QBC32DRAFT_107736 [Pseudoneurospora amorphoporcata]|uniref:Uncharacterized protein n=1 Tax=Pseudoneurospora amorphoporcata TaxID=241081 RepID=A0AAN6NNN8_9PEZI|nr:hypothetical protein QBC32DRAFT_107736 [Pseudoneurospora amorphoporcata]